MLGVVKEGKKEKSLLQGRRTSILFRTFILLEYGTLLSFHERNEHFTSVTEKRKLPVWSTCWQREKGDWTPHVFSCKKGSEATGVAPAPLAILKLDCWSAQCSMDQSHLLSVWKKKRMSAALSKWGSLPAVQYVEIFIIV